MIDEYLKCLGGNLVGKIKVGLISLGCDKNRVDSEIILSKLNRKFQIVNDEKQAEIIIINTCGFIEASKEESINTILEMAEYKKNYACKLLVATGCLTQRYSEELIKLIPEIDIMLGVNDYGKLIEIIDSKFKTEDEKEILCNYSDTNINEGERILTTGKYSAYLRIAEGCDKFCTYCIIPKIRGKYRSREMENIIDEAKSLSEQGVKEIILIAQDTTNYGTDIYSEKKLHILLKKLSAIEKLQWIRILYCYPEEMYDELISEIADNPKVCKYIDLPIQHISTDILKKMNRKSSGEEIRNIIYNLRSKIKGLAIRTSIIVGFPGESEENFSELKEFIKEIKFDKLGVFKYSKEEDTPAFHLPDQVDEAVKEQREKELMLMQQKISKGINKEKIGKCYDILIEGYDGEMYFGRSYEMAPEIDGDILFESKHTLDVGQIKKVKITGAYEYDLIGVVCNESC